MTLQTAAAYARKRSKFGKPIGAYQAISHPLANLVTDAEGARLLTWRAIWNIAQGAPDAAATISPAAEPVGSGGHVAVRTHLTALRKMALTPT